MISGLRRDDDAELGKRAIACVGVFEAELEDSESEAAGGGRPEAWA